MRTGLAGVVACVACTKSTPAPEPQLGSNHEPALAIARDAAAPPIDAAPLRCSAETFGTHTEQPPRRAARMSCESRDTRREFQPEQFDSHRERAPRATISVPHPADASGG